MQTEHLTKKVDHLLEFVLNPVKTASVPMTASENCETTNLLVKPWSGSREPKEERLHQWMNYSPVTTSQVTMSVLQAKTSVGV